MEIALSELDWSHFGIWLGVIAGVLLLFLVVLMFLAYRKK